ncbi:hypothetical protein BXZ70DRAFT_939717 [Cristinia sonorae]|uniref:Transmembrane protein n=1 Tax=Cristinia sonorae TaxID=1940300 RepID=A0A8K0XP69_9AGAR|nr:hypothetical protein BXZ70DRAFT_939717 [Cristinia sonorae]
MPCLQDLPQRLVIKLSLDRTRRPLSSPFPLSMASTRRQFSPIFALFALLATSVNEVGAQGTNATCLPEFDWMSNSRGQSPCLVTAYLTTPCLTNPTDAYVYALPPGFHYRPPIPASATSCQCNTIFFSTIQACATCQGNPLVPWSTWNMNCTAAIYERIYPESIPSGTSVPSWAYLDVSRSDNFNATAALVEKNENHPESTLQTGNPTSTINAPGSSASNPANTTTPLPSPPGPTAPSKSSNTGPIVGGVVGGLGGLAIAGAIAFFVWRWYRGRHAAGTTAIPTSDPDAFAPGVNYGGSNEKPYADLASPVPVTHSTYVPAKVYDPNDPSTFPTGGAEPTIETAASSTIYNGTSGLHYSPYQQTGGQYRGAPEV